MKFILPGGSGQVGTFLSRELLRMGHEVVVLSRRAMEADWKVLRWDAETLGAWVEEFEGADVVLNLAGRSVNCRYGSRNRQEIKESRVRTTRLVGEAIRAASTPPRVWMQSSTATIYAHRFDEANDEFSGIIGGSEEDAPDTWKFSIDVAKSWERAVEEIETPRTRKVLMRSAMTMSPDLGGVFDTLLRLVRFGLGGTMGDGKQFVSWVHDADFLRAILWLVEQDEVSGPVNIAAPEPLPNAEFMRVLRAAWGIRFGLPATSWMLEVGAWFMRTETELVQKSRRVVPSLLESRGFTFEFPSWPEAAADLCRRWRAANRSRN